jgi:hypothetical protein
MSPALVGLGSDEGGQDWPDAERQRDDVYAT